MMSPIQDDSTRIWDVLTSFMWGGGRGVTVNTGREQAWTSCANCNTHVMLYIRYVQYQSCSSLAYPTTL